MQMFLCVANAFMYLISSAIKWYALQICLFSDMVSYLWVEFLMDNDLPIFLDYGFCL